MIKPLKLLAGFGIELEYMIVDKATFNVKSVADELFKTVTGTTTNIVHNTRIDWSNELVTHVVEFKNNHPEKKIIPLIPYFQEQVRRANLALSEFNAVLMPTAVHPWMNPDTETRLWPHENNQIYSAYDRIFGCKGHGWSNLQSLHINISFHTDDEFKRLHSAIRFLLPLIPAISSSSPFIDGAKTKYKSNRLYHYLQNQRRIPSIIGLAVPEVIHSQAEYQKKVLEPMYKDISHWDIDGHLQEEWLNSRGAIPKFERGCIEIRLSDVQEAPFVDISIAQFWINVITQIVKGKRFDLTKADQVSTQDLRNILNLTVEKAESAVIDNKKYLALFDLTENATAKELLESLFEGLSLTIVDDLWAQTLSSLLQQGSLSTRMTQLYKEDDVKASLIEISKRLSYCLGEGIFFEA